MPGTGSTTVTRPKSQTTNCELFSTRSSGILLHPTSLPGPYGLGDLGANAHAFADFLASAGQGWWQMLPVGPIGAGNSPYDSPSAFAGSPLLVALEPLVESGWLRPDEIAAPASLAQARQADYTEAERFRESRMRTAFERFSAARHGTDAQAFEEFRERCKTWLRDYALFRALKQANRGACWTEWPREYRDRSSAGLELAWTRLKQEIEYAEFQQFLFDRQWSALREHCRRVGVRLLGDIPIYVAHDGAETWAHRELFHLDARGRRRVVAGVPPDFFSKTGQLWGNPLYRWPKNQRTGFEWWVSRLGTALSRFDALRLDHFVGLRRYWEVPADAQTAEHGRFVRAPGEAFFRTLTSRFGGLPFIAEDLGLITPEVSALRQRFGLPGMVVLQFAFGANGAGREYQPHRYERHSVVYTGTHDNDTSVGWLTSLMGEQATTEQREEAARVLAYVGCDPGSFHWELIRLALMSVANTAIFPMQDLLGLGSEARMNVPGTMVGNWQWRMDPQQRLPEIAQKMADLCSRYERLPKPEARLP
ncbi:MAG: 4-alpha-glucanotransferase [Polyangiaceae bacterium]|nr:4-alpha-glucanotransferase [Polyangiaceae bacterium]